MHLYDSQHDEPYRQPQDHGQVYQKACRRLFRAYEKRLDGRIRADRKASGDRRRRHPLRLLRPLEKTGGKRRKRDRTLSQQTQSPRR